MFDHQFLKNHNQIVIHNKIKYSILVNEVLAIRSKGVLKKTKTTFQCVECDKTISSWGEAIDHVEDSVTPTETDIMGDFDKAIKMLKDHPD